MYADQYRDGEPGHASPEMLTWLHVPDYPISRLRDAVDKKWFAAEVQMWADEGEPDRFADMLTEPIRSPVVIFDDGQGGWTWDGNHRIGARLTTGESTIDATVGISSELFQAWVRQPHGEAAFSLVDTVGAGARAAISWLQAQPQTRKVVPHG